MMKFIYTFFAILFFLAGTAQNEYLVKLNGDTLFGNSIHLKNKKFLIKEDNKETTVDAKEIARIKSSRYRGSVVVNCVLQRYIDDPILLYKDYTPVMESDTVMILTEEFTGPKMNMYMGTDNWKGQYYFYKTPSDPQPVQLVVRYMLSGGLNSFDMRTNRRTETDTQILELKGYVNQLRAIMEGCRKFNEDTWSSLSYRIYSIKDVIKRYNKCK